MESTDELETVNRWNNEYDDNFGVHNNDDVMMNESWNHFDSDEDKSFNLLDYNTKFKKCLLWIFNKIVNSKKIKQQIVNKKKKHECRWNVCVWLNLVIS